MNQYESNDTANMFPTPAPTEAPCARSSREAYRPIKLKDDKSEPTPSPATKGKNRSAIPSRTFKIQQKNDRTSAATAVHKAIAKLKDSGNWADMTVEERRDAIVDKYERTIEVRANHPMWWSAKSHFPEEHDEREEMGWLVETFQRFLEPELEKGGRPKQGGVSYEESDDEEESKGEDDDEEIVVKREGLGVEGQQDAGEDEEAAKRIQGDRQMRTLEKEIKERMGVLEMLAKRKNPTSVLPSAKKAKKGVSESNAAHAKKEDSSDEEEQAAGETVIFTAISRGNAISSKSGLRRRLEVRF